MTKTRKLKIILVVSILSLVAVTPVFAADIIFQAKTNEVQVSEQLEVNLFVNSAEESVNAFEGKVVFPNDLLELKEIRDGNTIVNFWIEKPRNKNGAIVFSGVTPGGFKGRSGLIFKGVFEAEKEGVAQFEVNDARVLRNDGTGSMATLSVAPFEVVVSQGVSGEIPALPDVRDTEPPESFVPEISRDESIFDGKWFVVFATQDKASGTDHYEVKESRQRILSMVGTWVTAESPYALADQELRSSVFVKAVDRAGNERIVKIARRNPVAWYESYENWIIIIVGILIVWTLLLKRKKLWRKRSAL